MSIKWSAIKVSEVMDEVEQQLFLADQFIAQAKMKATEARSIANLPEYMQGRLIRLITDIERIDRVKTTIEAVRSAIPDGAIGAERESSRHGSTQSLI